MMICAPQEQVYGAEGWMIRDGNPVQEQAPETPVWVPVLLLLLLVVMMSPGGSEGEGQ